MQWGISVDLGSVQHPRYGTAHNLKAQLPLLSDSIYELKTITRDRIQHISQQLLSQFRSLFPNDSDGKARAKVCVPLVLGIFQNPTLNWEESPGLRAMVNLMIHAIALDDVVDSTVKILDGVTNYRVFSAFLDVLGKPELDLNKFLVGVDEGGDSEGETSVLDVFRVLLNGYNKAILDLLSTHASDTSIQHFLRESMHSATASFLALSSKSTTSCETLSHASYNRKLLQFTHGMRMAVEGNAIVNGETSVPDAVRNTLLFGMLMDCAGNGTAILNDIVGLQRDIAQDAWEDTRILRNVVEGGRTLQDSFDDAVESFAAEVKDMDFILGVMEDMYGDVEGVDEFLRVLRNTFMGTCLSYTHEFSQARYIGAAVDAIMLVKGQVNGVRDDERNIGVKKVCCNRKSSELEERNGHDNFVFQTKNG